IHAFPLGPRMWDPQRALLAERGWRVLAPEFARPPSGSDGRLPTVDDYAGRIIDELDSQHVTDAVLCGLSMGGYIAFAIHRLAPRYVRGLVLADTRSHADTPQGREGRVRLTAVVREQGPSAVADEMIPKLLGETSKRERTELGPLLRSMI